MTVTLILIAITCVVSFAAFQNEKWMRNWIFWPPAITRNREYHRFVTYGLLHADAQHLLFNMITLYFFGSIIERFFTSHIGAIGFAGFYVLGLIASILPSYVKNKNNAQYRSLGASGSVSAVLFAFILLQPWATIVVFVVPVPAIMYAVLYIVYTIVMDKQRRDNVNHSAHLWGAAYGVLFAVVMEPRILGAFFEQLAHPRFG